MRMPLFAAVLSVSSLEESRRFYGSLLGLNSSDEQVHSGDAFERYWRLPVGSSANSVSFSMNNQTVGRVVVMEFNVPYRKVIPQPGDRTYVGLWNLNFYVDDIYMATKSLQESGYSFWSEPISYQVSTEAGQPIEVLFDGPDGLAINLVQLTGDDTAIGRLRKRVDKAGKTTKGYSPVSTTSHSIDDYPPARQFYEEIIGLKVFIDDTLDKEETNYFLHRPRNARTRATFLENNSPYGKVALSYPLNYEVPDRRQLQLPPNIGYLAQSFIVQDIEKSLLQCAGMGIQIYSGPLIVDLTDRGLCNSVIVHSPGSGALIQLICFIK
jgi:catechol 2,3-dioxygenase-like lactoylglutathione lyase family enzyme